jgi:hypothetical protein
MGQVAVGTWSWGGRKKKGNIWNYWQSFPPRRTTRKPLTYYGYVGRRRRGRHCHPGGKHRKVGAARRCSEQAAKRLNQERTRID